MMHDEETDPTLPGNFLGQTATSRREVFPTFWEVTPSPPSRCAGVGTQLVAEIAEKLMSLCDCLPEKISSNSVAANASRLRPTYVYFNHFT